MPIQAIEGLTTLLVLQLVGRDGKFLDSYFLTLFSMIQSVTSSLPEPLQPPINWIHANADEDDGSPAANLLITMIQSWSALLPLVNLSLVEEKFPEYYLFIYKQERPYSRFLAFSKPLSI